MTIMSSNMVRMEVQEPYRKYLWELRAKAHAREAQKRLGGNIV